MWYKSRENIFNDFRSWNQIISNIFDDMLLNCVICKLKTSQINDWDYHRITWSCDVITCARAITDDVMNCKKVEVTVRMLLK